MKLQAGAAGWSRLLAALVVTSRAAAAAEVSAGAGGGGGQPRPRAAQFVPSFGPPVQPVFQFYHEPQFQAGHAGFGDSFASSPPDPLLNALQATPAPLAEGLSSLPERLQLSAQPQHLGQLSPAPLYAASPLYKALDGGARLELPEAPVSAQTPPPPPFPRSSLHNPHSFHSVVNYGVISVHHGDHFEPHGNGIAASERHDKPAGEQRSAPRLEQSTSEAVALSPQPQPQPPAGREAPRQPQQSPDVETLAMEPTSSKDVE